MIAQPEIVQESTAPAPESPFAVTFLGNAPLTEVVAYLLDRHHTYTKTSLARLPPLAEKVARVHGERHGHLAEVRDLVNALRDDLLLHLTKEEHVLFPFIATLAEGRTTTFPCGSIAGPIEVMKADHRTTDDILFAIREQANGFVVPDDACGSFRALYDGLRDLEDDLREHMVIEESILFPRALRLAERRLERSITSIWGFASRGTADAVLNRSEASRCTNP